MTWQLLDTAEYNVPMAMSSAMWFFTTHIGERTQLRVGQISRAPRVKQSTCSQMRSIQLVTHHFGAVSDY